MPKEFLAEHLAEACAGILTSAFPWKEVSGAGQGAGLGRAGPGCGWPVGFGEDGSVSWGYEPEGTSRLLTEIFLSFQRPKPRERLCLCVPRVTRP